MEYKSIVICDSKMSPFHQTKFKTGKGHWAICQEMSILFFFYILNPHTKFSTLTRKLVDDMMNLEIFSVTLFKRYSCFSKRRYLYI